MYSSLFHLCQRIIIVTFLVVLFRPFVLGQNSTMLTPYYFDTGHYILDLAYVHSKDPNADLFSHIANTAIVYLNGDLLGFVLDDSWDRIVYGDYKNWSKTFGKAGINDNEFIYPSGITIDGVGNIYVADTRNSRIVNLQYNSTNQEIYPNYFSTFGESILQNPGDLDVDDFGNTNYLDDVLWVVDNSLNQIIPIKLWGWNYGSYWGNGPITFLYNPATNAYYQDLSGICGIAVRKSGTGVNSTSNRRLYLVDWKLRKLFLVEAEAVENGEGRIYKEKSFNDNVVLSGVESDYFGDVWVVDNANNAIYKYTWDLQYLDELTGLNGPTSIASVRHHNENIAITERWTNTTGNRTYSQGADIKNISIQSSINAANFSFRLTNYCYLVAKVYKGTSLQTVLEDGTNVSPSGNVSYNWYIENPSGVYTLKLWAKAYHDQTIYRLRSQQFTFSLTADISGPTELEYKEIGTWTAVTTGGGDRINYQWYVKFDGSNTWYAKSTASSYSRTMLDNGFTLKLTVSSNGENVETTQHVDYMNLRPPSGKIQEDIPDYYALGQNFPNPFNPFTRIQYQLPEASDVLIVIYNLKGEEVIRWESAGESGGYKHIIWDGKNQNGRTVPSGMYICQFSAKAVQGEKEFRTTRKMLLLK